MDETVVTDDVAFQDFWPTDALAPLNTEALPENESEQGLIPFQVTGPEYIELKEALYFGRIVAEEVRVLVDEASLRNHSQELRILQNLLSVIGVTPRYYYLKERHSTGFRAELLAVLQRYWGGQATFRNLKMYSDPELSNELEELSQGAVCEYVVRQAEGAIKGRNAFSDILLTAPTGAGKSVLFQVPAIYLAEHHNRITVVVSPLKALMQDQVMAMKEDRHYEGVACINSDISLLERDNIIAGIKAGDISIVYLSPELLLSYDIKYFLGERKIGLLVIDEAHLVTTWGRDFRVDYWFLGNYIRKVRKHTGLHFPVFAVTATAVYSGDNDMVFDTIGSLDMQHPKSFIGNVRRDEIGFNIRPFTNLPTGSHEKDKIAQTAMVIQQMLEEGKKAIVYFPWKRTIRDVVQCLSAEARESIGMYYSDLSVEERQTVLRRFKEGSIRVVLATKAFGMGVDISDIEEVYHHAPSGTVADYVQEIGRVARRADVTGIASTDYHPKDLKFSRILFGLSSLKQFQVKLVLEKLNNIYKLRHQRNFLVSVDDFAHIFPDSDDPSQKVKSALLVLEKDMQARYDYPAIIVRPKSLHTTVYACVPAEDKERFVADFGKYLTEVFLPARTEVPRRVNSITTVIPRTTSTLARFKIQLDKLWEDNFREESFPAVKHRFFKQELFVGYPKVSPQLQLTMQFNQPIGETLAPLTAAFAKLEQVLFSFNSAYFTEIRLKASMREAFGSDTFAQNISNLLVSLYTEVNNFGANGRGGATTGHFMHKRRSQTGEGYEYRVLDSGFSKVRADARRQFQSVFGGMAPDVAEYTNYIPANSEKNAQTVKLVYILELFGLSTFSLSGGEQPQLFIRVNDPLKLDGLAKSKYSNPTIRDVERRHKVNTEIMQQFFSTPLEDEARWTFIEKYFLGKGVEELVLEEPVAEEEE